MPRKPPADWQALSGTEAGDPAADRHALAAIMVDVMALIAEAERAV